MTTDVWIFGYGSLVNTQTHGYPETYAATLRGWRRDWRVWNAGPTAHSTVLTIEESPDAHIEGLVARVPYERWQDLQNRESGYRFFALDQETVTFDGPRDAPILTFQSLSTVAGHDEKPIAQSYLDCVLKGFETVHGDDALQRFFETTDGWHTPVIRDRKAPIYPRAVSLSDAEHARYDDMATKNGVRFIHLTP